MMKMTLMIDFNSINFWIGGYMKLKSETKQVIKFLNSRNDLILEGTTLAAACKILDLNYDMVQRALISLHKANIISRDSRGLHSKYQYPAQIGLGDVIHAVERL